MDDQEQVMEFNQFNGALPSPPDERDYGIARLVAEAPALPDEFISVRPYKIKNQGSVTVA